MIEVRNLWVRYAEEYALKDVNLEIKAGECVLITGPSGCGKSTLARVLTGLIPHAIPAHIQGAVKVADLDVLATPLPQISQQVGVVFQNPSSQLFHLRVEDEVAFGPYNLGLPPAEVAGRVEWALEAVDLLSLRDCRPSDLSGGQKQRVAIAGALAMLPKILVLDEPTASLDVPGTRAVVDILQRLQTQYSVTIVLIEHRLAEVANLADRVILMDGGQIIAEGGTDILQDRDLICRLGMRRPVDTAPVEWQALLQPSQGDGSQRPLLELKGVSAGYNGHAILNDIYLELYPGEFTALVGDNGAGKSTLALAAAGLLKPSKGKIIYWRGEKACSPQPGLDISLLFQNPEDQIFTDSVDEEVAFGPRNYGRFSSQAHEQILQQAGLAHLRLRRPTLISVGQQQRTALSASLALFPRLLILDEPTLGQDWGHLQKLMDFLASLNEAGTTILLITHDYKLVHHYAQRIILMAGGRIALDGRLRHPHMEEEK